MGLRFQKVLRIIPGVRLNLSKSGLSGSVGPRGASVNVGRHGVTTSAGLPGTGLSYRQRMGHPGSLIGIVLLVAALGYSAWRNHMLDAFVPAPSGHVLHTTAGSRAAQTVIAAGQQASGLRYVHRANSVLRGDPTASSPALKHEAKGARVTLLETSGDWAKVQDGTTTGWMRASVLGSAPPE